GNSLNQGRRYEDSLGSGSGIDLFHRHGACAGRQADLAAGENEVVQSAGENQRAQGRSKKGVHERMPAQGKEKLSATLRDPRAPRRPFLSPADAIARYG